MTNDLAQLLESLSVRPQIHVPTVTFETVVSYLTGLHVGLAFAGIKYTWDDFAAAAEVRGWDSRGSEGIVRAFRHKELPEVEMIHEYIAVTRDAYARAMARRGPQL